MININGTIFKDSDAKFPFNNRGFAYGDALFETVKINDRPLFWEDHYFRLMASMRILRMEIPMNFTPEFLENQILELVESQKIKSVSYRAKLMVYRTAGGYYKPNSNSVEYTISVSPLDSDLYTINETAYEVELFKDFLIAPNLLSTLKTNNKAINVIGSIFARENNYHNCLLLNTNKNVIEALNGNIFLVKDRIVKTPPIADGCLKGVIREQLLDLISKSPEYELQKASISAFELQKADEIFITNVVSGIVPVTLFRKKLYTKKASNKFLNSLNLKLKLA